MVNFNDIRKLGTNQEDGFEEFVCQLARKEVIPNSKKFIRIGNPDGGLECYWELNDGSVTGWQAKFFTTSLSYSNRWDQIKNSIKSALENYNLNKIIIAIPYDLAKIDQGNLESKISEWKSLPEANGKEFEIEFWWEHDLITRLQKPENEGFRKFWFNNLEFTDTWFENQAKKSIENLGDKYSRVLNIKTNNKIYFDSVSRNDDFKNYFYEKTHPYFVNIYKSIKDIEDCFEKLFTKPNNVFNFKYSFEELKIEILKLDFEDYETFNLKKIFGLIKQCKNELNFKLTFLDKSTQNTFQHSLNNANDNLLILKEFLNRDEIKITNNPIILFYGEAGMGKSFLFGDIADTKINNNESVVLLLGQQFGRLKDPENIIVEELGLSNNYNFDDFLDALECKSHIDKSRIIVLVDALDDGKGPNLWNRYLPGFFDKISKRNRISFIFSIRTTFLNDSNEQNPHKLKIPQTSNIVKIEITGFQDNYNARIEFFEHYKIQFSNRYMLSPELNNPLFLKIFCESLNNYGIHEIPNDLEGFSTIMNFYISSINLKLAHKCRYYPDINLVNKVLIQLMENDMGNQDIPIEKANELIISTLNDYPFRHMFLQKLLEEGILIKFPGSSSGLIINITFQRFKDYIIVKHYVNSLNMNQFLEFLKELLNNTTPYNKRILDMLSIYLPEKFDIEIYELLDDDLKSDSELMDSFIQSLKWRRNSINEKVFEYINNHILKDYGTGQIFLETLISLAPIENHLFNAYRTHKMLKHLTLSERDGFWTIFLHNQNYEKSEVNNLLDFAFLENHEYYTDESLKLASIMITWFLSTTNKKLRDKSTYALVNLLKNKLDILKDLLQLFEDVDDPYILERLYAASYGCVLNSKDYENLEVLSNYIYETIFNQEIVYPHILIRDYARNIVEFSISKNCEFNDEMHIVKEKITPPYSSEFPRIPSDDEIGKYKTENRAVEKIFSSMLVEYDRDGKLLMYGDFGRYTFQSYFSMWENVLKENNIYFQDLMNIAIDKIFKLNYNEEIHGQFDEYDVGLYEHEEFTERIGKKYQWMALYELLAQVSDKFPTIYEDYISNEKNIPYQGPWQDNIRNIDPTITCTKNLPEACCEFEEKYPPKNFLNDDWIGDIQDLPDFSKIIESNMKIGETTVNGLILEGNLTWIKRPDFGQEEYPKKEIWCQIRSYIVKNNEFDKIVPVLKHKNFNGRWMPESHENYELFNKEFYQSITFDYFYNNGWNEKRELNLNDNKYDVNVTTSKYSGSERSSVVNKNYMRINKTLFEELNLKYGEENSFIYDENNNLVGFDTDEFDNIHNSAFIFNKGKFIEYLKENNLKIFFTILGEKMIINLWGVDSKIQTFSGVYYFNGNDVIKGEIKPYSKCYFEELETSVTGIVNEIEINMENTFENKLYVDNNNKIAYLFIETETEECSAKKEFITTENIEDYEWNIYSLDKNKIEKECLKFISDQIGEVNDSYLIYCKINEKYYNIVVTSTFEEINSNRSKLYQQFIKPLLFNMVIKLTRNYSFGNDEYQFRLLMQGR